MAHLNGESKARKWFISIFNVLEHIAKNLAHLAVWEPGVYFVYNRWREDTESFFGTGTM